MDIKNLVKVEGKILTITTLAVGDVYIRLDTQGSQDDTRLRYGVVTNILANGEEMVLVAIERGKSRYGSDIEVSTKTFKTGEDLQLFAADGTSFLAEVNQLTDAAESKVRAAERELVKAQAMLTDVESMRALEPSLDEVLHRVITAGEASEE